MEDVGDGSDIDWVFYVMNMIISNESGRANSRYNIFEDVWDNVQIWKKECVLRLSNVVFHVLRLPAEKWRDELVVTLVN